MKYLLVSITLVMALSLALFLQPAHATYQPKTCQPSPSLEPSPTSEAPIEITSTPEPTNQPDHNTSVSIPQQPQTQSNTYSPPVCSGIFPDKPLLQGFQRLSPTEVAFSYWGVPTDKYSVKYGYEKDQLVYGIPLLPSTSTSFTISMLEPNRNVWAVITSYKGECAIESDPLDP